MSHSKRGLRRIEDDLTHEGYNPIIDEGRAGRGLSAPSGMQFLLRPFDPVTDDEGITRPSTNFAVGVWTFVLTLVGCMLFSVVYILVLDQQVTAANTSTSPFIAALTAAIFTVGPMMWSFDTDLRIHTIPGIVVANVGTLDTGLVTALVLLVAQFGGYAIGGVISKAILGTVALADVATGTPAYWLAWLATSITVFVFIYNDKFEFNREYEVDNHTRAANWTGYWSFGFRLAFYGLGLRSLNSGLYLALGIVSDNFDLTPGDTVTDWAFYIFVPLFASAATAFLLYYLASFFIRYREMDINIISYRRRRRGGDPDYNQTKASIQSRAGAYGGQTRSRAVSKRALDTEF